MSIKIPAVLLAAFLLAVTVSAKSPPQGELTFPSGDWVDDLGAQSLVVRSLYGRLAAYTTGSGERLKFEVDDIRILDPLEFDRVPWLEIVSMPGGEMINMLRSLHRDDYHGTATVTYRPSWSVGEDTWKLSEEGSKLIGMTIADVLREASQQQPQLAGVERVTAYEVTVQMGGRSRSYRAALLWYPSVSGTERQFLVVDNITQGVEEAAGESLPLESLREPPGEIEPFQGNPEKCKCAPLSVTLDEEHSATGIAGHQTGGHHSFAHFKATCSCSGSCVSICEASVLPDSKCEDNGPTALCHRMAHEGLGSKNRVNKGRLQGARCAAGFGCVMKVCPYCLCDFKVKVVFKGIRVYFPVSGIPGNPDWKGNQPLPWNCPPCIPIP